MFSHKYEGYNNNNNNNNAVAVTMD